MAGRLRTIVALAAAAAITPPIAALQWLAVTTGIGRTTAAQHLWCRVVARILGLRLVIRGAPCAERPLLIVANHVSWMDIVVVGAAAEIVFVAKGDMAGWPVMGRLARLAGTIFVDRANRRGSASQAADLAARLAGGAAVVLFAEGTTADGIRLKPFKSSLIGGVEMLLAEGGHRQVHVQPVALRYARDHGMAARRRDLMASSWIGDEDLAPHVGRYLSGAVYDVEVCFEEAFAVTPGTDRKAVSRRAEAAIRSALARARRDPL